MSEILMIDYLTLAAITISLVFGLLRGAVKEILSLFNWIAAIIIARNTNRILEFLSIDFFEGREVLLFIGNLIIKAIQSIIKNLGLGGVDRFLGGIFGMLKACVIIGVFYYLVDSFTNDLGDWWSDSLTVSIYSELPIFNDMDLLIETSQDVTEQIMGSEL
jgi:membrane protein required for colicin V production